MGKQKKPPPRAILSPAEAVAAAFEEVDGIDCINLMQGRRVDDAFSTGSMTLDLILGGGYKPGLMGTIFGTEGSGKSTLLTAHVVSAQLLGIPVVIYDPEAGSDPVYMRTMGVDFKYKVTVKNGRKTITAPGFYYCQPETGESIYRHMLHTMAHMERVNSGPTRVLFIVDSFEGMASEEVDEVGDGGRIADEARMHSYFLKRVVPRMRARRVNLIGSNQMRTAIGTYGSPLREAGGKALQYWPGYKIKTSYKKIDQDNSKVQTLPVVWRTTKNKAFPPHRTTDMRIMLGRGIDPGWDAFHFLKHLNLIETRQGKHKILLPGHGKVLSWSDFRRATENPHFRARCFEMLQDNATYQTYFQHSDEATYFYDADYGDEVAPEDAEARNVEVVDDALKDEVDDEAAAYEENRTKRRQQGKRPPGKTKAEDHAALDYDNLFDD